MHQFSTSRDIFRIIYSKLKIMVAYKKNYKKEEEKKIAKMLQKEKVLESRLLREESLTCKNVTLFGHLNSRKYYDN